MTRLLRFSYPIFFALLTASCATIVGGSRYNAAILVNGRPSSSIYYNGLMVGHGSASVKIKRRDAHKVTMVVKEDGCADQTFAYHSRILRGWAIVGTIVTFTTSEYIPIGLAIDLIDGAVWKPDVAEIGITKHNYKNYQYTLNYTGCSTQSGSGGPTTVDDRLVDVVYLKNGSIIRGTIIEQDPATQVKIQTRDGSVFVYKVSEIEKITRE